MTFGFIEAEKASFPINRMCPRGFPCAVYKNARALGTPGQRMVLGRVEPR